MRLTGICQRFNKRQSHFFFKGTSTVVCMTRLFQGLVGLALLIGLSAAPGVLAASPQDITAIQDVIQRSNAEQVQAIASRDPSGMADTVTSAHYDQLVGVNQNLLDSGVTSIKLINLDWGAITVSGTSATATTYETWSTVLADGTNMRSRDQNDYTLVLEGGAWKIAADEHPNTAPSSQSAPPTTQSAPVRTDTSHNWSGYAATGGTFTAVSGTWAIPPFNSAESNFGVDAAWVGIGGVSSRDLIQAGTQETVAGTGHAEYQAWIETLPQASRPVNLSVHPGDSVSVSIDEAGANIWQIHFGNNTTGQTYDETVSYRSSHSSAEWVQEAPSGVRGGLLPLANFGTIAFSGGQAVKNGQTVSIADAGGTSITMVNGAEQALAVPSALGSDGASFSVARTQTPGTLATTQRARSPRIRLPFPVFPLPGLGD